MPIELSQPRIRRQAPVTMSFIVEHAKQAVTDKQTNVVIFSATAIALYGYDQGMMSLINTNNDYLSTMGLEEESPQVGVIVVCIHFWRYRQSVHNEKLTTSSRSTIWDAP